MTDDLFIIFFRFRSVVGSICKPDVSRFLVSVVRLYVQFLRKSLVVMFFSFAWPESSSRVHSKISQYNNK